MKNRTILTTLSMLTYSLETLLALPGGCNRDNEPTLRLKKMINRKNNANNK